MTTKTIANLRRRDKILLKFDLLTTMATNIQMSSLGRVKFLSRIWTQRSAYS